MLTCLSWVHRDWQSFDFSFQAFDSDEFASLSPLVSEDVSSFQTAHHQVGVVSHLQNINHIDDEFYGTLDVFEKCIADAETEHYPWGDLAGYLTPPVCSGAYKTRLDYQEPLLAEDEPQVSIFGAEAAQKSFIQPVLASSSSNAPTHKLPQQGREAVVKNWVLDNSGSPYPDRDEFLSLVAASSLTPKQVKNALSNHRARVLPSKLSNTTCGY
jgi:hypothetical protein